MRDIFQVGLINGKFKYLTAETFGFKINANGSSLKKKQLWTLEGSEHQVFLRSHLDRYLAVDQFGNVTCESEDSSDPGCAFQIQLASDGTAPRLICIKRHIKKIQLRARNFLISSKSRYLLPERNSRYVKRDIHCTYIRSNTTEEAEMGERTEINLDNSNGFDIGVISFSHRNAHSEISIRKLSFNRIERSISGNGYFYLLSTWRLPSVIPNIRHQSGLCNEWLY